MRRGFRLIDEAHAFLVAVLIGIGGVLLHPRPTFPGSTSFHAMAEWASEAAWGSAFLCVGIIGVLGIAYAGRYARYARAGSALLVGTMHGIFAGFLFWANPVSTGSLTYACIAVFAYRVAARRVSDAA